MYSIKLDVALSNCDIAFMHELTAIRLREVAGHHSMLKCPIFGAAARLIHNAACF